MMYTFVNLPRLKTMLVTIYSNLMYNVCSALQDNCLVTIATNVFHHLPRLQALLVVVVVTLSHCQFYRFLQGNPVFSIHHSNLLDSLQIM